MDGTAPTDDPVNQMILALRRLSSTFAASNRAVGEALRLKGGDSAVFDALNREGLRAPTELVCRTRTYVVAMTGILVRFEGDGWIERRPDLADRRSVRIHAAGADRLVGVHSCVNEELAEHVSGRPVEQVETITCFFAGVGDIATAFSERMTTERES